MAAMYLLEIKAPLQIPDISIKLFFKTFFITVDKLDFKTLYYFSKFKALTFWNTSGDDLAQI